MKDEMYRLMCAVRREDRSPAMQAAIAAELEAERVALFAACAARKAERLAERKAKRSAKASGKIRPNINDLRKKRYKGIGQRKIHEASR